MAADNESADGGDIQRYEQLRHQVLAGEPSGWRLGLAVFQHRGTAAWARAWRSTAPAPVPRPAPGPVAGGDEVVGVLANMALACLRE